jgi:hypothetical protein
MLLSPNIAPGGKVSLAGFDLITWFMIFSAFCVRWLELQRELVEAGAPIAAAACCTAAAA